MEEVLGKESGVSNEIQREDHCTPHEFAEKYGINQQNVYYWIRKYDLGYKDDSNYWWLTEEDQERLKELKEARSPAKQFAKEPHGKNTRKRGTESVDSIRAKLKLTRDDARVMNVLINYPLNEKVYGAITALCDFKEPHKDSFDHEKLLMIMGHILGLPKIGAIAMRDGYPFFKYVVPKRKDDFTVVFNLRTQVFYIDNVEKILERSRDLEKQDTNISVPTP